MPLLLRWTLVDAFHETLSVEVESTGLACDQYHHLRRSLRGNHFELGAAGNVMAFIEHDNWLSALQLSKALVRLRAKDRVAVSIAEKAAEMVRQPS